MARCREFCIGERVKCRELFLNNILYVDSALDLVQLTSSLLMPGKQGCRGAFGRHFVRINAAYRKQCMQAGPVEASYGPVAGLSEASWGVLGASWAPLRGLLGASWRLLRHRRGSGRHSEALRRGCWRSWRGVVNCAVCADGFLALPSDA